MIAKVEDPSKKYMLSRPIWVQQVFNMIKNKEDWTAGEEDALSRLFEQMMSRENHQEIIKNSFANTNPEELGLLIKMLAYLRIEQAIYFLTEMPIENKHDFIRAITSCGGDQVEAERINLLSRLETLSKLNMLNRIFSPERIKLVTSVLANYSVAEA